MGMRTLAAKDAKNSFGQLLDAAQTEPVVISKNGRPFTVMISHDEWQRFQALEDAVWAARADEAVRRNELLSAEETAGFIREMLGRADT